MDGRKYDHKTLESIRLLAMERVANGDSPASVVRSLGLSRSCIYRWMAKFRDGGSGALKARRIVGRPKKMERAQSDALLETLLNRMPADFHLGCGHWTRELMADFLRRKEGLELSPASVARLCFGLGLLAHPPLYKFFRSEPFDAPAAQRPTTVEWAWFASEYPKIKAVARAQRAEIYFLWLPETTNHGLVQLTAVTARGVEHFKLIEGPMTGAVLCEFLDGLCHGRKRPLIALARPHRLWKDPEFRGYAMANRARFTLYLLPADATPFQNPDPEMPDSASGKSPLAQHPTLSAYPGGATILLALMAACMRLAWPFLHPCAWRGGNP